MYGNLLPIGSVVQLRGGEKRIMVVGRVVASTDDAVHDYMGVLYPEGMTGSDSFYFFESDSIERVFAVGFQDGEEADYRDEVLSKLGELVARDGVIVSAES